MMNKKVPGKTEGLSVCQYGLCPCPPIPSHSPKTACLGRLETELPLGVSVNVVSGPAMDW